MITETQNTWVCDVTITKTSWFYRFKRFIRHSLGRYTPHELFVDELANIVSKQITDEVDKEILAKLQDELEKLRTLNT